jgi:uncharacterized membrane protein YdjX (TVP38/TMEM64 family)
VTPRALRLAKIGVALLVVASLAVAYRLGVFEQLSDPKSFAHALAATGAWGYAAFIVAYAVLQPFGVPGTVFVVAAPLIWPWPIAFALSMVGTMAASVIGFSFARFVARDWVAAHIPARFRRYDEALARNAFRTVFLLRLIFWMPQVLHGFLGISKVPFWTHFWGSLLGYLVPLFFVSYFGSTLFDEAGHLQMPPWPTLVAFFASTLLLVTIVRMGEKRASAGSMPKG